MCYYLPSPKVHSNCRCLGKNDLFDQGLKLTNAYKDRFNTHCHLAVIRNRRDKKDWAWRDDCSQENWIYPCLRSWFLMLGGIRLFIADLTAACVAVSSLSNWLDSFAGALISGEGREGWVLVQKVLCCLIFWNKKSNMSYPNLDTQNYHSFDICFAGDE